MCHASCLWGGSADLLDTLVEIRQFMDNNPKEVVTIIFEDYLKNPTILKRVFDRSGISHHVLIDEYWAGSGRYDWPSLIEMRTLGRVVVFNNNGLDGFPYSPWSMWYYVRENRYGSDSQNNEVKREARRKNSPLHKLMSFNTHNNTQSDTCIYT